MITFALIEDAIFSLLDAKRTGLLSVSDVAEYINHPHEASKRALVAYENASLPELRYSIEFDASGEKIEIIRNEN